MEQKKVYKVLCMLLLVGILALSIVILSKMKNLKCKEGSEGYDEGYSTQCTQPGPRSPNMKPCCNSSNNPVTKNSRGQDNGERDSWGVFYEKGSVCLPTNEGDTPYDRLSACLGNCMYNDKGCQDFCKSMIK
jgi:hypothetical protein